MNRINSRFIKFLLVGVVNTIFGYSIFFVLVYLGVHYSIASLLATIIGILFNFKTIGNVVFRESNNTLIIKFILVYLTMYLINLLFIIILKKYVSVFISAAILMLPLAILSYLLNKILVFRGKNEKN